MRLNYAIEGTLIGTFMIVRSLVGIGLNTVSITERGTVW